MFTPVMPMLGVLSIVQQQPVTHAIFLLAIVADAGLALGPISAAASHWGPRA